MHVKKGAAMPYLNLKIAGTVEPGAVAALAARLRAL